MTIQTPDIKQIKGKVGNTFWWMGENAFFGFLILFFMALLISSFVFYQYVFSARDVQLQAELSQTKFQEQTLQRVVQTWQDREVEFQSAGQEFVRNIFVPPQPVAENAEESN